jgi:hypothetical protein
MESMSRLLATLLIVFAATACGGGGVKQRLFPPEASIQELTIQPDGSWKLKVRVQNFSNVAMTVARVQAELRIATSSAGQIVLTPDVAVPPEAAEVFETTLRPQTSAAYAVLSATSKRQGGQVSYTLAGRIDSSAPDERRDEFEFSSRLSTVPGLERVLR